MAPKAEAQSKKKRLPGSLLGGNLCPSASPGRDATRQGIRREFLGFCSTGSMCMRLVDEEGTKQMHEKDSTTAALA